MNLIVSNLIVIINLINLHVMQLINLPVNQKFAERIFNNYQCRVNLMFRTSFGFLVESYYNESGEACKIYCRVKLTIINSGKESGNTFMMNAPLYTTCGLLKFCINGQCVAVNTNSKSGAAVGITGSDESETIVIPTQASPEMGEQPQQQPFPENGAVPPIKCNNPSNLINFTRSSMILFNMIG